MRALSLLIKPASGNCNMRCKYCFYANVTENREIENHGIMTIDTLEIIVKKTLEEAEDFCLFGFQGGEPMLAGLDFFRALIDFEKKYNHNKVAIQHSIQTNGLCIDKAWADFFKENDFLVGLSIDSTKHVHDSLRLDVAGNGTHLRCLEAARLLKEVGVQFNILSVITKPLAMYPQKAYKFYERHKFHHIQFIPCIDSWGEDESDNGYSLTPESYGKFLCEVFDLWYEDLVDGRYTSIRTFDNYAQILAGRPPENCAARGKCTPYPLIEADGSVYPCDFYALDDFLLGNIMIHSFSELLNSPAAKKFAAPTLIPDPECKECPYFQLCRGGCRRDRDPSANPEGLLKRNRFCESYKIFFHHALPKMTHIAKTILRRGN